MSFPRYPAYKDSGEEWLGPVPVGWQITPLKGIARVINGYPFDSKLFDPSEGLPLVRIRDLNQLLPDTRYRGEFIHAASIDNDDVLIGMDGDFNVGRWLGEVPALLNQRMCCVRANSSTITRYLQYVLPVPLKAINDITYSTTVKHLSSFDVLKIRVALPELDHEIAGIVRFLDRETAKIDALIAEQQRLIELLQEKRQAVISHAVTKGLNPDAPMRDSGVEWLGEVPEHWQITKLEHTCFFEAGKAHEPFVDDEGRYVCVNARFVSTGGASIKRCTQNLTPARVNDILMVMSDLPNGKALAKAYYVEQDDIYAVNQRVCIVRPMAGNPRFLYYQLDRNPGLLWFDDGVNQTHIPNSGYTKLVILAPPIDEQSQIARYLDNQLGEVDALVKMSASQQSLLKERRSALISAAVTGQIDVRGLAPAEAAA